MRVRTSISIPEKLQEQIEQYAEETKRTVSAVCELALEQFFRLEAELKVAEAEDGRAKSEALS